MTNGYGFVPNDPFSVRNERERNELLWRKWVAGLTREQAERERLELIREFSEKMNIPYDEAYRKLQGLSLDELYQTTADLETVARRAAQRKADRKSIREPSGQTDQAQTAQEQPIQGRFGQVMALGTVNEAPGQGTGQKVVDNPMKGPVEADPFADPFDDPDPFDDIFEEEEHGIPEVKEPLKNQIWRITNGDRMNSLVGEAGKVPTDDQVIASCVVNQDMRLSDVFVLLIGVLGLLLALFASWTTDAMMRRDIGPLEFIGAEIVLWAIPAALFVLTGWLLFRRRDERRWERGERRTAERIVEGMAEAKMFRKDMRVKDFEVCVRHVSDSRYWAYMDYRSKERFEAIRKKMEEVAEFMDLEQGWDFTVNPDWSNSERNSRRHYHYIFKVALDEEDQFGDI